MLRFLLVRLLVVALFLAVFFLALFAAAAAPPAPPPVRPGPPFVCTQGRVAVRVSDGALVRPWRCVAPAPATPRRAPR